MIRNPLWKDVADAFEMFNNWFDIFNMKSPSTSQKEKNAFGINLESQTETIENMTFFIGNTLVFGSKKGFDFKTVLG